MYNADMMPHEWTPYACDYGDDLAVLMRIYYIGSQASGIIDIASTGDITFKHGALSSEAVDTDTALDDGAVGVIDVSADVTDYFSLMNRINSSTNWRCVLVGALPTDDPHTTTAGHYKTVTGGNCTPATAPLGYAVLSDDNGGTFSTSAGMTFRGVPTKTHNSDSQVYHEIYRIVAKSTYASGTSAIKVYECDDELDTATEILSLAAGATTAEVAYPAETYPASEPLAFTKGKRLVVKLVNSAAISVVRLKVVGRSYAFGPSVRQDKLYSEQCQ